MIICYSHVTEVDLSLYAIAVWVVTAVGIYYGTTGRLPAACGATRDYRCTPARYIGSRYRKTRLLNHPVYRGIIHRGAKSPQHIFTHKPDRGRGIGIWTPVEYIIIIIIIILRIPAVCIILLYVFLKRSAKTIICARGRNMRRPSPRIYMNIYIYMYVKIYNALHRNRSRCICILFLCKVNI